MLKNKQSILKTEIQSETSQSASTTFNSSGSKTSSSRSETSSQKPEKEEDLTKDNVGSPIDLEFRIQNERLTKILDEAIYKIKLAICLPELARGNTLKSLLPYQDYEDVMLIFEYSQLSSISLLDSISTVDEVMLNEISPHKRQNPVQAHVIHILNSCPALKPIIQEIIDQMRDEVILQTKPQQLALRFLSTFEDFRNLAVIKFESTAAEELGIKFSLRKTQESNEILISKINELSTSLKEETEAFEANILKKNETISALEDELLWIGYNDTMNREKIILDTERQMVLRSRSHAIKKEILMEEESQTQEGYNTCLKTHLALEKEMRRRRFKVETQLISWIQKYDQDMTEKQEELDDFIEKFDREEKLVEELQEQMDEMDKEYLPLMEEREKEYHQEMSDKMAEFMHEHAARVIQYFWRMVLSNRKEKIKLKKLIQKKKAEEERLEAIRMRKEKAELARLKKESKKEKKKK